MQKLSCEAISWVLAWSCRVKAALRSYCLSFRVELSCKSCLTFFFLSLCMQLSCKSYLRTYFLSFCIELSCKSCLLKLFCKLLFGTVVKKLPCESISQGKMSISISGFCNELLSNGRGLGRSVSYVGRSQVSLFMLYGSVVHKLPFAAASFCMGPSRKSCHAKLPPSFGMEL